MSEPDLEFVDPGVPQDLRHRVVIAALDELTKWGVERFSIEAVAARHDLDKALIYRYWGDGQRVLVDALAHWSAGYTNAPAAGSLRGDLERLALDVVECFNSDPGRQILRGLVMDERSSYGDRTRQVFWSQRFGIIRAVLDGAAERGELREGVEPLSAMQILIAPLTVRALYTEEPITREYGMTIAELAWHALVRPGSTTC